MDGNFGLNKDTAAVRLLKSYENEIQAIAKTEYVTQLRHQSGPSLYNRAMSWLGDLLVESGTRLKSHDSVQQVYRTH